MVSVNLAEYKWFKQFQFQRTLLAWFMWKFANVTLYTIKKLQKQMQKQCNIIYIEYKIYTTAICCDKLL